MNGQLHDAVTAFLHIAAYHPCLLLVHPQISTLETATKGLMDQYAWPHLSVGGALAEVLFSVPAAERGYRAQEWLETTLDTAAPGPLLLTEIDLLFEPTLHLDALALLRQASRAARLVVAWPGTFEDGTLAYALPEHHHYRTWPRPEVQVVSLD